MTEPTPAVAIFDEWRAELHSGIGLADELDDVRSRLAALSAAPGERVTREQVDELRIEGALSAILEADRDICEWIQFGKYLRKNTVRPNYSSHCPTMAAIEKSQRCVEQLRLAYATFKPASPPPGTET